MLKHSEIWGGGLVEVVDLLIAKQFPACSVSIKKAFLEGIVSGKVRKTEKPRIQWISLNMSQMHGRDCQSIKALQ